MFSRTGLPSNVEYTFWPLLKKMHHRYGLSSWQFRLVSAIASFFSQFGYGWNTVILTLVFRLSIFALAVFVVVLIYAAATGQYHGTPVSVP